MRFGFFPKLAWTGITKNRKLYLPYILTCIGMILMFYIMQSLSVSTLLPNMRGGGQVGIILSLGKFVIAVFALIFLFYTNSFLIRRRFREFGLYSILGMDKKSLVRVIVCESSIVSAIGLTGGVVLGIIFSKLAELVLLNVIRADIDYSFTVSGKSIVITAALFAAIFLILMVRSIISVFRSKPLELIRSENFGEKAPKANWVCAILGVALLAGAYYIAVTIKTPLAALAVFFVAVIMVIVATYLLFISGSVAICKMLQHNRRFYYKKDNFVSVSSMVYRMKRNGAGLASICILSTMVLVMISSTSSLYFGGTDSIVDRFTRENGVSIGCGNLDLISDDSANQVRDRFDAVFASHNVTPVNTICYRYVSVYVPIDGLNCEIPDDGASSFNIRDTYFISAEEYNAASGTKLAVGKGQALIYESECEFPGDVISVGSVSLDIAGRIDSFGGLNTLEESTEPTLLIVISDYSELLPAAELKTQYDETALVSKWYFAFDLDADDKTSIAVLDDIRNEIPVIDFLHDAGGYSYYIDCLAEYKSSFYTTYGGLFMLGIMLSIVFIFAATMIIYYKQVSEGYEDQTRFEIMQKVGMTKSDIKKSINSQVLTVFFAPLFFAGLHLAFAFPLVWKMLQLFMLTDIVPVICLTIGSFLLFGLFYAIIYLLTARAYYSIVSGSGD